MENETQSPMSAEELVANYNKKDLLELAEKLNTPDVKSDNNKDEIAAKIVAHRDGTGTGKPTENAQAPALEGAPAHPAGFTQLAAITVSKSSEDGQLYVNFTHGKEARSAGNVSQVGIIAQQFFADVLG